MRHLKPGIVSLHVDTLATLGLLERKSVPGDRRKLRLVPTEKAGPIIARGRAMQESFAKTLAPGARGGRTRLLCPLYGDHLAESGARSRADAEMKGTAL